MMKSYETLLTAVASPHVLLVTLNRPEVSNALNTQMGRDLLDLGIIPLDNMLPETAFMKLSWVLGQTDDPAKIREMLTTPINHEITPREPHA